MDSFAYAQTKNIETVPSLLGIQKSVSEQPNSKKKTDNLQNPNFTAAEHARQPCEQDSEDRQGLPRRDQKCQLFRSHRAWQEDVATHEALKTTSADIFRNLRRPTMGYNVSMEEPETPRSWEGHSPWQDPFPQASLEEAGETKAPPPPPWGGWPAEGHQQLLVKTHSTAHLPRPLSHSKQTAAEGTNPPALPGDQVFISGCLGGGESKHGYSGEGEEPLPATAYRQGSTLLDKGQKQKTLP